ncbi:hypothetical protein GCM10022423_14240 [Flavobacterium ginsengiterrae]|uniref:TonB C-terminal domain-containing protein n=1 Tax=Flavobacterium ginsengiterrae TaxID=871695 RepID=A0ABP7GFT0_9FLAO
MKVLNKEYCQGLIFAILLLFVNAKITAQEKEETVKASDVYLSVEIAASFPGGTFAMVQFIQDKFKIPPKAVRKKSKGTIVLNFTVEKDGSLADIYLFNDLGYGINEELERVLKLSPRWIPASINGKSVAQMRQIPIRIDATQRDAFITVL